MSLPIIPFQIRFLFHIYSNQKQAGCQSVLKETIILLFFIERVKYFLGTGNRSCFHIIHFLVCLPLPFGWHC